MHPTFTDNQNAASRAHFGIICLMFGRYFSYISNSLVFSNDLRAIGFSLLSTISLLGTIGGSILLIMWYLSVYKNLQKMDEVKAEFSENTSWVAVMWFVPIANMFAPYQLFKKIWLNIQIAANPNEVIQSKMWLNIQNAANSSEIIQPKILFWWLLLILDGIIIQLFARSSQLTDALTELNTNIHLTENIQISFLAFTIPLLTCSFIGYNMLNFVRQINLFERDAIDYQNNKNAPTDFSKHLVV